MKKITLALITLIFIPTVSLAQTTTRITFSVDTKDHKTDAAAIGRIEKQAKKIAKEKCAKKTKFQSTAISINVGSVANGKYTANANYTGDCKSRR